MSFTRLIESQQEEGSAAVVSVSSDAHVDDEAKREESRTKASLDKTDQTDAPTLTRQISKEQEKDETEAILPLAQSFRRQQSFPHTVRPVPALQGENKKDYFFGLLKGMGFNDSDIDPVLEEHGDKAFEEIVEILSEKRGKKFVGETSETKGSEDSEDDPPLTLRLSFSRNFDVDWKCRFCAGYQNSANTEVCILCCRSRLLCELVEDDQIPLRDRKHMEDKSRQEAEAREELERQTRLMKETEELEQGHPWPCRFCDTVNPPLFLVCKACLSPKYLTKVLLTGEEWNARLRQAGETQRKEEAEDKAYREEWEKKKAAGGTIECLICFDEVPVKDVVFASCRHNFCVTCWNGYLEVKVRDGEVLKLNCPAPKCRRPVTRTEIKNRLTPEMFEKFSKFHAQAQMSINPNARWCPTPDCESVMIGSKDSPHLRCPKCAHEICFKCNHDWHTGTCERAARGLVGVAADRAAFAAYAMVANIKPCPQCRSPIAKDDGCNHMTCQRCGYEFCWMCLGRYTHNHFALWNIFGCPGGQAGALACLGDDRLCCLDLSCGCGLFGFVKRSLLKIIFIAIGLACCPCIACFGLISCICSAAD